MELEEDSTETIDPSKAANSLLEPSEWKGPVQRGARAELQCKTNRDFDMVFTGGKKIIKPLHVQWVAIMKRGSVISLVGRLQDGEAVVKRSEIFFQIKKSVLVDVEAADEECMNSKDVPTLVD